MQSVQYRILSGNRLILVEHTEETCEKIKGGKY